jgi:protein involved in temperature-dependent protein secretion
MSSVSTESVIDEVLSALKAMNAGDMERAESRLREVADFQPDAAVMAKLWQARVLAVNARRLWRSSLPESDSVIYSRAGEATPVANAAGMSITA